MSRRNKGKTGPTSDSSNYSIIGPETKPCYAGDKTLMAQRAQREKAAKDKKEKERLEWIRLNDEKRKKEEEDRIAAQAQIASQA